MPLIWKIDECSIQGSDIHLRGWCVHSSLPIRRVEAVFLEPLTVVPLATFGLPSPDVAAAVKPGATGNRFDEHLCKPSHVIGRRFRLQCVLGDGTVALADADVADVAQAGPLEPGVPSGGGDARDAASIRAEIEAVQRREREFRASIDREFRDRGEGNTYTHTLRREIAELRKRDQEMSAQLESLVRKLEAAIERKDSMRREAESLNVSPRR